MDNKTLTRKSKELSYLLRHDSTYQFKENGYRTVLNLVKYHGFTEEMLNEIVNTDEKGRYEFNNDCTLIRARQGHSVEVDVQLEEKIPPFWLYHGTSIKTLDVILKDGIKSMSRQYVHLSFDVETAMNVGKRHGIPVVLVIDTKKMSEDGIKFYVSNNNVPLVSYVEPKYIIGYGASNKPDKMIGFRFDDK